MIDLVLNAADEATIRAFAEGQGVLYPDGLIRQEVAYGAWRGDGKFVISPPSGTPGNYTPATYMPGFTSIIRLDLVGDELAEGPAQWQRSAFAKYIKTNGAAGADNGLQYYAYQGVKLFNNGQVDTWLAARNIPSHEWSGGNEY